MGMAEPQADVSDNRGKWDQWYKQLDPDQPSAFRYGDTGSYLLAAAFLCDCKLVEDWGCGAGGFKRYRQHGLIGVDGSQTPFADRLVDLCQYRSRVEGILLRHVLEHNVGWRDILDNAVSSFTRKLALILFTPFSEQTHQIAYVSEIGVPDLSFAQEDIEERLTNCNWTLFRDLESMTGYAVEHAYLCWR